MNTIKIIKNFIIFNTKPWLDFFISSTDLIADIKNLQKIQHKSWDTVREIFSKKINELNLKTGVEIGVAFGGHSEYMLKNTQITKLYGIDPYKHFWFYFDPMNLSQRKFDFLYAFVIGKLNTFGDRFELIRTTSEKAVRYVDKIDFIYIDGNHSYEQTKKDIENWYEKINTGGLIGGDDYDHPSFPGVKKAVDEFFKQKDLQITVEHGGVWYVINNNLK
jgi:hypothetical protein